MDHESLPDAPDEPQGDRSFERARCARELEEAARACRALESRYRSARGLRAAQSFWPVFAAYGEERGQFSDALEAAASGIADTRRRPAPVPPAWEHSTPAAVLAACEEGEGVAASACLRALVAPLPRTVYQAVMCQLDAIVRAKRHLRTLRESDPED
jgi:hypothetical protein